MAIIALPAKFGFTNIENFSLVRQSNLARSRYTGKTQKIIYPYAVWEFKGTLVDYPEPEASAIRGFLTALEGVKNSFRLPVPGYVRPQNGFGGNGTLAANVAAQNTSLSCSGLPASSLVLKAGDYFTINDELKMVTADVNTTAGGIGTIIFQPPMRAAVNAGAVVFLQGPWALLRAADDDIAAWAIKPPIFHNVKIEATEDF